MNENLLAELLQDIEKDFSTMKQCINWGDAKHAEFYATAVYRQTFSIATLTLEVLS